MQTERRVTTNPQTKPADLSCESAANWQLPPTTTVTIYYYYSALKLIILTHVLPQSQCVHRTFLGLCLYKICGIFQAIFLSETHRHTSHVLK